MGQGGNWSIPVFWAPTLRYVAAPALAIVYGFSYPNFYQLRNDPLHVLGFGVGHIGVMIVIAGFIVPKWFDVFIPPSRRGEGLVTYGANVDANIEQMEENARLENAKKLNKEEDSLNAEGLRGERDPVSSTSSRDNTVDGGVSDEALREKNAL